MTCPQMQLPKNRTITVLDEADCCVVGGGVSGVAAAVAAARGGAKTVLIERGVALGGSQTLALVEPWMPTFAPESDTPWVKEVEARLRAEGCDTTDGTTDYVWTNPETIAFVYDSLTAETGVRVLYHAALTEAVVEDGHVAAVLVQTIGGVFAVRARVFIDATGDALLARLAGVPAEAGYEKTGRNQPMSFRFEMGGVDLERLARYIVEELGDDWCKTRPPFFEIAQARHRDIRYKLEPFFVRGIETGELTEADAEYFQAFTVPGKPGVMSMNCPELPADRFSASDPLSYSEAVREGRASMRRVSRYLIRHMPGFEHAYISREAAMLGVRESWRIVGRARVTAADYYARRRFPDAVARTAWYIDAHGEKVGDYLAAGEFYEIPYRAMVANEIKNLIVTGRCISVDFLTQASMRIQRTCMSLGEAAGVAAAWCVAHGETPNALAWEKIPQTVRSYVSVS